MRERRISTDLLSTALAKRAFFTGAYANYVLAVTLSGTGSMEEGARVMGSWPTSSTLGLLRESSRAIEQLIVIIEVHILK